MGYLWLLVVIGAIQVDQALSLQCACANVAVHVRDGVGTTHTILTTLATHHCLTFKGTEHTDSAGAKWANVDYNGHNGWIHENYITISTRSSCSGTSTPSHVQLAGCPHIVTRAQWHARPSGTDTRLSQVPKNMYIHHGATAGCYTKTACTHMVQSYQNYHMDGHHWSDIGYSFVVGEDGNVYEARGWDRVGAHTKGHNTDGLAICVIGNFQDHVPNDKALNAVKQLIKCAHDNGKIQSNYIIKGHRDVGQTACPGQKFYDLIQHWPHYHH